MNATEGTLLVISTLSLFMRNFIVGLCLVISSAALGADTKPPEASVIYSYDEGFERLATPYAMSALAQIRSSNSSLSGPYETPFAAAVWRWLLLRTIQHR